MKLFGIHDNKQCIATKIIYQYILFTYDDMWQFIKHMFIYECNKNIWKLITLNYIAKKGNVQNLIDIYISQNLFR